MFAKQNSALTLFKPKPISLRQQLLSSGIFFLFSIAAGLATIMLLNDGTVNYIITPISHQKALFAALWEENPLRASQYILTKSVIVFAHKDPRSGLNLWTYEFDVISIVIYGLIALFGGRLLLKFFSSRGKYRLATLFGLCGSVLTLTSVSYMTVIEHCSGATWVGFVSLYGMGFSELELYPLWQWLCAGLGCFALAASWLLILRQPKGSV